MMIMASTCTGEVLQTISPGIFKDKIGAVAILNREAEVWVRIDLRPLTEEMELIEQLSQKLNELCTASSKWMKDLRLSCENLVKMSQTQVKNLHADYENMFPRRMKRQTFTEVANLGVKILFGTIDHLNKKATERKIQVLMDNSKKQEKINFDMFQLIEKSISDQNDTNEVLSHHRELIDFLDNKITEMTKVLRDHEYELHAGLQFQSLSQQFQAFYSANDNKLRDLHQMFTDLQNNVLNTNIIGMETILEAFMTINYHDERLKFPINLKDPDYDTLQKLSTYTVFLKNETLLIEINLPLIEDRMGIAEKFYSVPKLVNDIAYFVRTGSNYLIRDSELEKFVSWTEFTFDKNCLKIGQIFYCKNLNMMSKEKETCEYKLLSGIYDKLNTICGEDSIKIEKTLLIKT